MLQQRNLKPCYVAASCLSFLLCFFSVARAECTSNNEPECSGYWNIYASIPNGDRWEFDRDGSDSVAIMADRKAKQIVAHLGACGVNSQLSNSSWFSGFTRDLLIVHSNPFNNENAAKVELVRAKQCGINGNTKFGKMNLPGAGDD